MVMRNDRFDEVEARFFAELLADIFDAGMLARTIVEAHGRGLFAVMAERPASTFDEIAAASGIDRADLALWLPVLSDGSVLRHDPDAETWHLPADHVPALTCWWADGPGRRAPDGGPAVGAAA